MYPAGLEFQENTECKVCGSAPDDPIVVMPRVLDLDLPLGRSFRIARCANCDTAFTSPVPTVSTISVLYTAVASTDIEYPESGPIGKLKDSFARRRLRHITRGLPAPPRTILDYATGGGRFAAAAQRTIPGVRVTGADFADAPPLNSYYDSNAALKYVSFAALENSPERYDLIIARHVLEHVHRPVQMIVDLMRLLKDSGTLYIETPNFASRTAKLLGARWPLLYVPRHLTHFTADTLRETIARAKATARIEYCEIPMMGNVVALACGRSRFDPAFRPLGLLLHPFQVLLEKFAGQGTCLVAYVGRDPHGGVTGETSA